jgi:hypothetical protein
MYPSPEQTRLLAVISFAFICHASSIIALFVQNCGSVAFTNAKESQKKTGFAANEQYAAVGEPPALGSLPSSLACHGIFMRRWHWLEGAASF